MSSIYGIDIGGTTVKIGLFRDEVLEKKWEIPTDVSDGGKNIVPDIVASLPEKADAVGIDVPGAVLPDYTVNRCVNLGWGVCRPGDELTALTGMPAVVGNDANAAALGEQWKGGGSEFEDIILITLGTAVGGGVILGGRLRGGAHGAAGEIGHICMNPRETRQCGCGNFGCLEQYCGALGFSKLTADAGLGDASAKEVFDLAKENHPIACDLTHDYFDTLGRAIGQLCASYDPQAVLLGGGISRAGEFLRAGVEASFRRYAFHACRETPILMATLGGDAGMYGAARMAINRLMK